MKLTEILLAAAITAVCVDFAVRVIRFALTGKGRGKDFRLIWWKKEKEENPRKATAEMLVKDFTVWLRAHIRKPATILCFASLIIGAALGAVMARPSAHVTAEAVSETKEEMPEQEQKSDNISEYQTDYDAACVARVLYGIREYDLSKTAKQAVIEVIINRVNDGACEFRAVNSVAAVCEQPNQWQGYNSNGIYLADDYDLALSVLHNESGKRVIPEGCFFLKVEHGKVTARTKWDGGNEWSVQ